MKIHHELDGQQMKIALRGDVLGANCDCLEHFWDRHVDNDVGRLELDLSDVFRLDAAACDSIAALLRRQEKHGTTITVHDPMNRLP